MKVFTLVVKKPKLRRNPHFRNCTSEYVTRETSVITYIYCKIVILSGILRLYITPRDANDHSHQEVWSLDHVVILCRLTHETLKHIEHEKSGVKRNGIRYQIGNLAR